MTSEELRRSFLEFFKERGHALVLSSSLLPDDPSVLLTTAGMQQFKPYFVGKADPMKDFGSLNTTSIQKSFRTSDIDEVGDERHLTFFEMMGNFSFGGYRKEEAIKYAYDFIVKEIGLEISYVTVFEGKESIGVSKDEESIALWKKLDPTIKVVEQGMEDVFWGPTGNSGPCGPTTEIYCKNAAGQDIEIWNIVFNQYMYEGSRGELDNGVPGKKLELLKIFGVDTGMGLERLAMVSQKVSTVFETDLFNFLMEKLPTRMDIREKRIVADHIRSVAFLISDGIRPSNKEQGYILRRLIRRVIVHQYVASQGSFSGNDIISFDETGLLGLVADTYKDFYPNLDKQVIWSVFNEEKTKFEKTLHNGLQELARIEHVDSQAAFKLYETFGLPFEVIRELGKEKSGSLTRKDFEKEFAKHQEISRAGAVKKFGGHGLLLDTGELKAANEEELQIVTRLHTATHLLQAALRKVLGETVHQAGSDITVERTRFDFTYERKLTPEELKSTEQLVNEAIEKDLVMEYKEMPFQEAIAAGALYSPKEKYPARVKVYSAWNPQTMEVFSRELCGGPHVSHTGEVEKVKIVKEEGVAAGVRRIRAVLE